MVEANELSIFLPEDFLDKLIFLAVPGREVIQKQAARVAGICIQATTVTSLPWR